MTNLEKLQEMDYEEMAKFLLDRIDEPCSFCPPDTICRSGGCRMCWENWLRREVKERMDAGYAINAGLLISRKTRE